ncbi:MAG: ATP-binding protein [Bacteroidota bacterium]
MISREIIPAILNQAGKGKVIILVGPRQVGKTTLLKNIAEEYGENVLWLNADETDIRISLEKTTSTRLKNLFGKHKLVIIDEAQSVENIGKTLKLAADTLKNIQVIATGSSAFELRNRSNEPLTGRKKEFLLFPVSVNEMYRHHGRTEEKRLLEQRMIYGLYPEVINHPGEEQQTLRELVSSYLYKDMLLADGLRKSSIIEKLTQALALQLGNEVSYHELGQLLGGVDHSTVEKYIDMLEKAYIIYRLPALSRNLRNELKKGKKIYFWDNGVRNAIIKNFNPLTLRNDTGALWENFMITERIKNNHYKGKWVNHYFWRTFAQQEVDYIEEYEGKFHAYEMKWNPKKKIKFPKTFSAAYPGSIQKIISPDTMDDFMDGKI